MLVLTTGKPPKEEVWHHLICVKRAAMSAARDNLKPVVFVPKKLMFPSGLTRHTSDYSMIHDVHVHCIYHYSACIVHCLQYDEYGNTS